MNETIKNKIVCDDCKNVLDYVEEESVDLIYLDPPFFSNKNYERIWSNGSELKAYEDRWKGGIEHYIGWMKERIKICYSILKKTGSFYLHCDWHANSYLRVMCDRIFGYKNFQGEIIWKRCSPHALKYGFDNITDTILYYSKSDDYTFNQQYFNITDDIEKFKGIEKETERRFTTSALDSSANSKCRGNRVFYKPNGDKVIIKCSLGWKWTQETIDKRWQKNNHIFHFTKGGRVRYKLYKDVYKGRKVHNIWYDIVPLSSNSKERIGYPTQKPEALIERIIKASSNEGDIILDPFVGGGTTISVAKKTGRNWIGFDVSPDACTTSYKRLYNNALDVFRIINYPVTMENVLALKPLHFQQWAVLTLNAKISPTLTSDGGIDGTFIDGTPIEIKQKKVGRRDVQLFESAIRDKDKKKGVIVGTEICKTAYEYIARMKKRGVVIIPLTLDDILAKNFSSIIKAGIKTRKGSLKDIM